jgi:hypothetical protein
MTPISNRHSPDVWRDESWLKDFLAKQLTLGRLSLVLGAGVSMGLGLPSWQVLVDSLYARAGQTLVDGQSLEVAAERLLNTGFGGDRVKFAEAIRLALYEPIKSHPRLAETSELMASLGALVMSSSRGRVSNVVTFNFDNLLEEHLESRGFVVRSIDALPAWSDVGDVTVLHPHGLLPRDTDIAIRRGVVFTQHDFAAIIGKEKDLWRQKVTEILRSHTCLFIGVSGGDMNLVSMLQSSGPEHCSRPDAFWGVRFSGPSDPMSGQWEARGLVNVSLSAHSFLPAWLLDVCQRAAKLRRVS